MISETVMGKTVDSRRMSRLIGSGVCLSSVCRCLSGCGGIEREMNVDAVVIINLGEVE